MIVQARLAYSVNKVVHPRSVLVLFEHLFTAFFECRHILFAWYFKQIREHCASVFSINKIDVETFVVAHGYLQFYIELSLLVCPFHCFHPFFCTLANKHILKLVAFMLLALFGCNIVIIAVFLSFVKLCKLIGLRPKKTVEGQCLLFFPAPHDSPFILFKDFHILGQHFTNLFGFVGNNNCVTLCNQSGIPEQQVQVNRYLSSFHRRFDTLFQIVCPKRISVLVNAVNLCQHFRQFFLRREKQHVVRDWFFFGIKEEEPIVVFFCRSCCLLLQQQLPSCGHFARYLLIGTSVT